MLHRNVGGLDRVIRLAAGIVLVPFGLFALGGAGGAIGGLVVAAVGVLPLVTGITGFCPLYVPFGFSTVRERSSPRRSRGAPPMPEESRDRREGRWSAGGRMEGGSSSPDEEAIGRMARACGCGPAMREMAMGCCGWGRRSGRAAPTPQPDVAAAGDDL